MYIKPFINKKVIILEKKNRTQTNKKMTNKKKSNKKMSNHKNNKMR